MSRTKLKEQNTFLNDKINNNLFTGKQGSGKQISSKKYLRQSKKKGCNIVEIDMMAEIRQFVERL